MVSQGTAVLVAGERRKLGFISKRQRKLPSAAPWHQRNVFGRISSALLYLIRVLVDRSVLCAQNGLCKKAENPCFVGRSVH